jgi:hypothetical protein
VLALHPGLKINCTEIIKLHTPYANLMNITHCKKEVTEILQTCIFFDPLPPTGVTKSTRSLLDFFLT